MKDIKSYIIGFLMCACMFLIMGQTKSDASFKSIVADKITVKEILIVGDELKALTKGEGLVKIHKDGLLIVENGLIDVAWGKDYNTWIQGTDIAGRYKANVAWEIVTTDNGYGNLKLNK